MAHMTHMSYSFVLLPGPVRSTLRKTNMDIQNDGLEKVAPFKHGSFWYLC